MSKIKILKKSTKKLIKASRKSFDAHLISLPDSPEGFASTSSYKDAVTKIYSRESNDIDNFLEFAQSLSSK